MATYDDVVERLTVRWCFAGVRRRFGGIASHGDTNIRDSAVFQFANARQQKILAVLDRIDDESMRRAALWNYLAKEIIAWAEPDTILKYEELIAQPAAYVEGLYRSFFTSQPPRFASDLHTRNDRQRYSIDDDDLKCIRSQCGESAALLGYGDV